MSAFDGLIGGVLAAEGGYSNNLADAGGETNFGITVGTARANDYAGAMADMTKADAIAIYRSAFWARPGLEAVSEIADAIAGELFDCGVNMGTGAAGMFLQRCLNVFNREQQDYQDIPTDGQVGPGTVKALTAFLVKRGAQGEAVLLKAIRCLRGARYISLAEAHQQDEQFVYGWIANRIV